MSAHSILGPSSAERWLHCPGSVAATKDIKEEPSRYAAEGTVAHRVADNCLQQGRAPGSWLGQTLVADGFEIIVTDEMVRAVETYLEYVDDLPGTKFHESRVEYRGWVAGGFGTLDFAAVDGAVCHIVDFKYGQGVQVHATDNAQLKLYALGFYELYGWMQPLTHFVLHIVQPRLEFVDRWEIGLSDLQQWASLTVRPKALEALSDNASFATGDWCRFCKIRATCRVRAQAVLETAIDGFTDIGEGETKVVAQLSNDEIARALGQVENIKRWCTDLKNYALSARSKGESIGDWKVVSGRSTRVYSLPPEQVADRLIDRGFSTGLIYAPPVLLSPAQLEKKIDKKVVAEFVEKRPGPPTLVPGSDPRPEIVLTDSEFSDVEES